MILGRDAVKLALSLWLVLVLAVGVKTVVSPTVHTVFPKMATRALDWWAGRSLYVQREGLGGFPYSPTFAIALTPFALAGHTAGGILWSWASIGVYLAGLRRCVRDVLPGSWVPRYEGLFLIVAMIGAIRGFWNAQSNALIVGFVMLGASAIARRRWWSASLLLAAPVFIKIWPMALALLFVALWLRPLGARFAIVMAVGALAPFCTQPFDAVVQEHQAWFAYLTAMTRMIIPTYHDVGTLLRYFEAPIGAGTYGAIQLATGASVLVWCLWQRRLGRDTRWLLTIALGMGTGWSMIFGPSVEYCTFVVLAPAISWALLRAFVVGRGRGLISVAFGMTMILGMGTIQRALQNDFPPAYFIMPAGALLFVLWVLVYAQPAPEEKAPTTIPNPREAVADEKNL